MGVSKYNSEGYYDPVVYEALTRIEAEEQPVGFGGRHSLLAVTYNEDDVRVEKQYYCAHRYQRTLEQMRTGLIAVDIFGDKEL